MSDEMRPNFEGHAERECGDHRTVGPHRAWCYDCHEWCYPEGACRGCELPGLRAENERLREALRELADWVRQYHVERDAAALGSAAADLALLATMRQSMFDAADAAAASLSETGGEGA